jgi:hypothetical protein
MQESCRLAIGRFLVAYEQHRRWRAAHNVLRITSHQHSANAAAPVRAANDKVGIDLLRLFYDALAG